MSETSTTYSPGPNESPVRSGCAGRQPGAREHHCFGCGTLNAIGLQLEFRAMPGGVWAELRIDRRFEGYIGMVHGGILTTMLDEAMSWAISAGDEFAVTTRLSTAFRSPAAVGSTLRVEGRVVELRRRLIDTVATIVDTGSDGLIAEAEGRFLRVSEEQARAWRETYLGTGAD